MNHTFPCSVCKEQISYNPEYYFFICPNHQETIWGAFYKENKMFMEKLQIGNLVINIQHEKMAYHFWGGHYPNGWVDVLGTAIYKEDGKQIFQTNSTSYINFDNMEESISKLKHLIIFS